MNFGSRIDPLKNVGNLSATTLKSFGNEVDKPATMRYRSAVGRGVGVRRSGKSYINHSNVDTYAEHPTV
jgi:hypothetical protein